MSKLIYRVKNADKDNIWQWSLFGLAGLIGLVAQIFDTKVKDKKYEKRLDAEIQAHAKRLMEEKKDA